MTGFNRFLSVATLLALTSAPVLRAQNQDDQPYDPQPQAAQSAPQYPQTNDQAPAPSYDQQAPPAPAYDQQAQPAPSYDQQAPPAPAYDQQAPPAPAYDQQAAPESAPSYDQQAPQNAPDQSEPMSEQPPAPAYNQAPPPPQQAPYDQSQQPPYDQSQQPPYDQSQQPPYDQSQQPPYDQNGYPESQANPPYDAQNNAPPAQPDAPARAARLQYMDGSVSLQPQGNGDWVNGELNRPLTNGDNIWADKNSRAEISVGTGIIRIDSETSLTATNIGENAVQLSLHQGALYLHVRRLYDGETYEVDTPNQAFTVQKPGDYRFDVDSDGDKTVITVWRGAGESTSDGPSVHLEANQQARFYEGTSLKHDIHAAPGADAFDQWAYSRDQRFDNSQSAKYVAPDAVGYEDLDDYGTWKNTPDYGEVWSPNVGPGWAPYYNGNWIWQNPWGWTWVEAEPWGFAPFHYGRWIWAGGSWGWSPGPIWVRPYYAPALVAWFGGPGWGLNFGFGFGGGFGWCPLGFGEPFIPWYHAGFGYFNRINFSNTRFGGGFNAAGVYRNNFLNGRPRPGAFSGNGMRYANLHAPGAFNAASRETMLNSRSIAHSGVRVSPSQLSRTSLTQVRSLGIRPTSANMAGGAARGAAAPARSFSHPVVSHMTPPSADRGGMRSAGAGGFAGRSGMNSGRGQFGRQGTMATRTPMNGGYPHPPNAGAMGQRGAYNNGARGSMNGGYGRPSSGVRPNYGARSMSPGMTSRSVPHPPAGGMPRGGAPSMSAPRGGGSSGGPHVGSPRGEMSAPRPYGSTTPRGYSSAADRGSYNAYGSRGMGSFGGYNRSMGSGGGSYGRAPSYGGSAYGGAYSRSMPSYNSGSSRSARDSYARNFGGGSSAFGASRSFNNRSFGGRSSGSFKGGRSFGGGGHSSGGHSGGGHSGGGHSSGGHSSGGHSGGGHGRH